MPRDRIDGNHGWRTPESGWEKGVSDAVWQSRSSKVGQAAAQERGVSAAQRGAGTEDPDVDAPAWSRNTVQPRGADDRRPPTAPRPSAGSFPSSPTRRRANQVQGNQTTDPGLGVLETGGLQSAGAGYSVAALGDMNLDGSNDYLIGAPGVTRSGTTITANGPRRPRSFLVFGNRSATIPNVQSWLSSTPEQRVGLLGAPGPGLGTNQQTNPFTARGEPYNYKFDGVSFITSQSPNSELGAFVASAGTNAFVIGAPNYTGGGRLYYITATSNFNLGSLRNAPIDLDNPQNYPGLTIVTFEDTANPTVRAGLILRRHSQRLRRRPGHARHRRAGGVA